MTSINPDAAPAETRFQERFNRPLPSGMRGVAVRGVAATGIAAVTSKLVQGMILARLFTPAEFGLIAMVAILTNFIDRFRDMGLSMATVQRREISHGQVSTLFHQNS